jgi:hydrogenase maturation protease
MSGLRPVRIVGVGSPNGDDAVGWHVIQAALESEWGDEAELHAIEGGQRLLNLLDGRGSLVLIDALAPAGSPGTLRRFAWPASGLDILRPGSTHDLRPAEALELATALGLLPARVVVWGIEGASFEACADLSPAVAAAIPDAVRAVREELLELTLESLDVEALS